MNLSTSNSKKTKKIISLSFAVTLLLLIIYNFMFGIGILKPGYGLNQWETNLIRLQNYVYQDWDKNEIVLAGTSVTAALPNPASLSNHPIINLGLNGDSVLTALKVINNKLIKPKILLVEADIRTITVDFNPRMFQSIYHPFLFNFRKLFYIFQKKYQPDYQIVKPSMDFMTSRFSSQKVNLQYLEQVNQIKERSISGFKAIYSNPFDQQSKALIVKNVSELKVLIHALEQHGTQVFLYRVPGDGSLETIMQTRQTLLRQLLPPDTFHWIPEPKSRLWKTNDGVHLAYPDEGRIFANHLFAFITTYLHEY